MVRAWYQNDDGELDECGTRKLLGIRELEKLGIIYFQLFSEDYDTCEKLNKIKKDRKCIFEDEVTIAPDKLDNYEEWVKSLWTEHMHPDEEFRLVTDGCGYFDVRDLDDRWIRIEIVRGDLIIVPAGLYHRFKLDEKEYINVRRYFTGAPRRVAFSRPADNHEARKAYLSKYNNRSLLNTVKTVLPKHSWESQKILA